MKLSHSKLDCCLTNPMDYFLNYKVGMKPKLEKTAFQVGSAMHWGFEHNTEDLTEWFNEYGTATQKGGGSIEQFQAEAMCHGYFHNYEKIMDEVLKDYDTGKRVELLNNESEYHELDIEANLPSFKHPDTPHKFVGVIDLLFLTKKGFIIIDYKSSSEIPEFSKYLDQIYRYIFMLEQNFPNVPIYKIGIINVVKSKIKKLQNENDTEFKMRWQRQYENWPTRLININMFDKSKLDKNVIDDYIGNLSREADLADAIDSQGLYYINFKNIMQPYPSDYLDIYNGEKDCYTLYSIRDTVLDPNSGEFLNRRDCVESDMDIIWKNNVLYRFDDYKRERESNPKESKEDFHMMMKKKYEVSDDLLEIYAKTKEAFDSK